MDFSPRSRDEYQQLDYIYPFVIIRIYILSGNHQTQQDTTRRNKIQLDSTRLKQTQLDSKGLNWTQGDYYILIYDQTCNLLRPKESCVILKWIEYYTMTNNLIIGVDRLKYIPTNYLNTDDYEIILKLLLMIKIVKLYFLTIPSKQK